MRYAAARQMDLFECGLDAAGISGAPEILMAAVPERERGRILIDEETGLRLGDSTRCAVCGKEHGLHKHHVFYGTANRQLSEEDGMVVYLCPDCHEHGARAVHRNHETDVALKQAAQRVWMADREADEDAFRARYGRSWL